MNSENTDKVPAIKTPDAFPTRHKSTRTRHRPKWRKWISKRLSFSAKRWNVILIIVTIIVIVIVGSIVLITDGVNRVQSSVANLSRVANNLTTKSGTDLTLTDVDRLQGSINDLIASLDVAKQRIIFIQPFKALNADANAIAVTLDASHDLAVAANDMLDGLRPTLFFMVAGDERKNVVTQISSGERVIELLQLGQGKFRHASDLLANAKANISGVTQANLSQSSILNLLGLIKYHDQLEQMNNLFTQAPNLLTAALGINSSYNYLILSQNSDELRPSGGYISTWGWMSVRNANITNYDYSPTTITSPSPPPLSMSDQIKIPSWWLSYDEPRYAAFDGSWYADFPSTAQMALWYYNNGNNDRAPLDATIAIDITGFEYILGALGSVVVPEFNEVVTSDNFRDVVYEIRADGEGDLPHKRFLAALYKQIFADWQTASSDPQINSKLLGALIQSLQEKHIMLYFPDDKLNHAIDLLGWSGSQNATSDHDYLMVADANLGNKSNHSITRQLTYDVSIQSDGTLSSRVGINYDYSARVAQTDPGVNAPTNGPLNYSNLMQVFVPSGSKLASSDNLLERAEVVDNATNSEFVRHLILEYDTSARFQYSYTTRPLIENFGPYKRYRLLLQKQPGTPGDAVSIQVTLPSDAKLISASPEPDASYTLDSLILEYQASMVTDKWIEVIYKN